MAPRRGTVKPTDFRFFQKHAGYVRGQRAAGALALARAEREADRRGWTTEWDHDPEPDLSFMTPRERKQEHEVLCAVLKDRDGKPLTSLCGIVDADRTYGRIVEAELALEALGSKGKRG
jgi:hypothetical protein